MAVTTSYLQNGAHTAQSDRLLIAALLGAPVAAFAPTGADTSVAGAHGVIRGTSLAVTAAGAMGLSVAAGSCFVRGSQSGQSANQGSYGVTSDAATALTVATAHGTYGRIDLVVVRVRDSYYSGVDNGAVIEIVTGTASASPAAPALPANALALATVTVGAGVTSINSGNITDQRRRAYTEGATAVCTSSTRPSAPTVGQVICETDTGNVLVWYGNTTGWRPPWNTAWGQVGSAVNSSYDQTGSGTTLIDVPSVAFAAAEVSGRRYRVMASADVYSTGGGDAVQISVVRSATVICRALSAPLVATQSGNVTCLGIYTAVATGSATWKLQFARGTGGGVPHTIAIPGVPTTLILEDIGPATAPA